LNIKLIKNHTLILLITGVLTLVSTLPLGLLSVLVTSLLIAFIGYITTKYHYTFLSFVVLFVFIISALFSGSFMFALITMLPIILCGIFLGVAYNLKLSLFKTLCIFVLIYILYFLVNIRFSGMADFEETVSLLTATYKDAFLSMYGNKISESDINAIISEAMTLLLKFMPSFIVIVCTLFALLCYYFFKCILKITKSDFSLYENFSMWHADKAFSVTFLILLLFGFFMPEKDYLGDAFLNVIAISSFVFYILGLSYICFALKKRMKSKVSFKIVIALLILSSLLTFGLPFFALCTIGALDGIFNYRQKAKKTSLPK